MNLAEELVKVRQELVSLKTSQQTGSDSAMLYRQTYTPGVYYGEGYARQHIITCITNRDLEKCIFMPIMQAPLAMQYITGENTPVRGFSNRVIWIQMGISNQFSGYSDTLTFMQSGITILSNVPFSISVATNVIGNY